MSGYPLLSLAIWIPIVAGLLILAVGRDSNPGLSRVLSLIGALAGLLITIPLYTQFDASATVMQFVELSPWIPRFNINYHLGVDGISMPFIILNSFITLIVVLAGWQVIQFKVAQYNAAFLIMSGLFNGIFCALDGILFYVFFEASLIPMYLIIGIWGGHNRVYAAIKFFLYTLFGSLLFLVAQLYLFIYSGGSFSILDWHQMPIPMGPQIAIFMAFLIAFAVKVPMWPVHTWLPDAHPEAPTGGSIVLAAIALKLGAYGFLRFSMPIVPDASHELAWLMITLSLIAVVYIGFVALALSFVALLFVAWADAYEVTQQIIPAIIMTLVQGTQMLFMLGFIVAADQDEREKLRETYADYQKTQVQTQAGQCPHCFKPVSSNNRARHIASCPARI